MRPPEILPLGAPLAPRRAGGGPLTIAPRRATPALLQVDSVLAHLPGPQGLAEVALYLTREFAEFGTVAFLGREGDQLRLLGSAGSHGTEAEVADSPLAARAVSEGTRLRAIAPDGSGEVALPIEADGRVRGVLTARTIPGRPLDASDEAFLAAVAQRIGKAGSLDGPERRL